MSVRAQVGAAGGWSSDCAPASSRATIFRPSTGPGGPHTGAAAGSGLGLAIARGFVEANGGRLRVESLPGQGSTFVVELPLPADEETLDA